MLEGESGSGKSSLLQTMLIPRARKQFHVVACRCGDDPFGKLRAELLNEHYKPGRKYGKPALMEAIEQARAGRPDESARPLLVCIDQFEELFVTVKDEVRRQFVETLGNARADGKLRLVVVIRKDFSDLLRDVRIEVDPDNRLFAFDRESYHVLRSFSVPRAMDVLNRMLDRDEFHGGNRLRRQDLDDFAKAFVEELKRPPLDARLCRKDEPLVLPVELQMVGWTYETILEGNFSAEDLRRRGGKLGIYQVFIEDAKDYATGKTGVTGATSVLVLRQLISDANTKWPRSVQQIARNVRLSPKVVDAVLQAFAERFLVHRLPDEDAGADSGGVASRRVRVAARAPRPAPGRGPRTGAPAGAGCGSPPAVLARPHTERFYPPDAGRHPGALVLAPRARFAGPQCAPHAHAPG